MVTKTTKKPAKKKAPKKSTPKVAAVVEPNFANALHKHFASNMCCRWRFPTFAVALLAVGLIWLLTELGVISANIPWWPIVIIMIALGFIINRFSNR